MSSGSMLKPRRLKPAHLSSQDLSKIDLSKIHALSPEVISRQATINIGTIGHVAHGKSTVVKAISGVQTIRFKDELERNITIKLGYANAKIYKCTNPQCVRPGSFTSYGSSKEDEPFCERCTQKMQLYRHVSFVDCPGHDILMATMLNGAAVMDACLLLVAGNEPCPQPQTSEHLAAVEIMKLNNIIILQNKIDLVRKEQALAQREDISRFVQNSAAKDAPIVPISAQLKYNMDVICELLCRDGTDGLAPVIPIPKRDYDRPARLIVIRSFDVNRPGTVEIDQLKGGIAGGSILQGILKVGDEIELRPGIVQKDSSGSVTCTPIFSRVLSLHAEDNELNFAVPGGLIGVGTKIDPTLCRADRLVGQVLGAVGSLPDVYLKIEIKYQLLQRLLGVKTDSDKEAKVARLNKNEVLNFNIGSTSTGGKIVWVKEDNRCRAHLVQPVCTELGAKVAISRRIEKHWRLIGWGEITKGSVVPIG